jgi:hypothetical protein
MLWHWTGRVQTPGEAGPNFKSSAARIRVVCCCGCARGGWIVWVCVIKLTILHQSCTGADFLITRKAARILSSFFFFSFFLSNVYERGHGSVLAMKNGGN